MGKFLDEKAIVNRNVERFNNYVNETTKYIEGNATMVTYYQKNVGASIEDVGLGNVVELVGAESPIKYNRIENFPLYAMSEINLAYDYSEETHLDTPIEGSAVVPANTLKPNTDELISISYLNKDYLFKITNVEGAHIGKKFSYRIEFTMSRSNIRILEERQVVERYKFSYDNLGSQNQPIIQSSLYDKLEIIEDVMYSMIQSYRKNFYNDKMNCFFFENNIDDNIHYFFDNNYNLLITKKTYMENMKVEPALKIFNAQYLDTYYNHSIHHFFESIIGKNREEVLELLNSELWFNDVKSLNIGRKGAGFNIFSRTPDSYCEYVWFASEENVDCDMVEYINDFYNTIQLEYYNQNWIASIVNYYIHTDQNLDERINNILTVLKEHEKQITKYTLEMYVFIPCILLILYALTNEINTTTNNFIYEKKGR